MVIQLRVEAVEQSPNPSESTVVVLGCQPVDSVGLLAKSHVLRYFAKRFRAESLLTASITRVVTSSRVATVVGVTSIDSVVRGPRAK